MAFGSFNLWRLQIADELSKTYVRVLKAELLLILAILLAIVFSLNGCKERRTFAERMEDLSRLRIRDLLASPSCHLQLRIRGNDRLSLRALRCSSLAPHAPSAFVCAAFDWCHGSDKDSVALFSQSQ